MTSDVIERIRRILSVACTECGAHNAECDRTVIGEWDAIPVSYTVGIMSYNAWAHFHSSRVRSAA